MWETYRTNNLASSINKYQGKMRLRVDIYTFKKIYETSKSNDMYWHGLDPDLNKLLKKKKKTGTLIPTLQNKKDHKRTL